MRQADQWTLQLPGAASYLTITHSADHSTEMDRDCAYRCQAVAVLLRPDILTLEDSR